MELHTESDVWDSPSAAGESVCVCVSRWLSARQHVFFLKPPAHACVSSPLAELPYKGVTVCIMEINLSAPVASLNNSQPVSHEPVVTPAAALIHFVFRVASGAEKNPHPGYIQNSWEKNEGALALNEPPQPCQSVITSSCCSQPQNFI